MTASTLALIRSILELGADLILYFVDWPFVCNLPGTEGVQGLQIPNDDRERILAGKARRLLKIYGRKWHRSLARIDPFETQRVLARLRRCAQPPLVGVRG